MAAERPSPRRCRLSVAMVVRNEQDVLAGTIESVRPIADEILVLDTGSSDQTPAVAEQLGASVGRAVWNDDFSAVRNRLLAEAAGEWVLWLDAGERLLAEWADPLRRFLDEEADPRKVYLLMVEAPSADPAASNEQAALPRLMPRGGNLRFHGRVRETVEPSLEAAGLKLDGAPGRIVRHRRVQEPARKTRLAQRDLKLVALEALETGSPEPRLAIALGEACSNLGDQPTARRAFVQAVRHSPPGSTEMLEAYYGLLSTFDGDLTGRDRQLALCLEALEVYPLDAQLLSAMGSYLQGRDQLDLAVRAFATAVTYGKVDPRSWHLCEIFEMAAAFLALTLQLQGKDDEARRALEQALARSSDSVRIRRHLIDLEIKHGRSEEAVRVAEGMPFDDHQRGPFCDAVRGAAKAAMQDWLPALSCLQRAYVAGCCDPLCLKWLAVTLLANGQTWAAEPILREWLGREPENAEVQAYLAALETQVIGFPSQPKEDAAIGGRLIVGESPSRHLRIDPGTTVTVVAPPRMPVIHEAFSTDTYA